MKVIFKGKTTTENHSDADVNILEKGKLYQALSHNLYLGGVTHYNVKVTEEKECIFPAEWFFNLTSALLEHSAKQANIFTVPVVGKSVELLLSIIPKKGDNRIQRITTSPIKQVEEIAPKWYYFITKNGTHYIAQLAPSVN